MGSGMNGQSFAFLGYLPANRESRVKKLAEID
jgi:16S rRNA C1402 (ribose-2'-O) methylase RsmI